MHSPPAYSTLVSPTLSCLVVGGDAALAADLVSRLQRSARVARVERLDDAIALQYALSVSRHDLVIHVLGAPDEPLPRCLRTQADLRVLLVAPDGVVGTLSRWLQQGATDLVSPDDEDGLRHSLSRLLDECVLLATVRQQSAVIATQRQQLAALSASPDREPLQVQRPQVAVERMSLRTVDTADGLPGRRQSLKRLIALQARAGRGHSDQRVLAMQVTLPFADGNDGSRLDRTLADLAIYRAAQTVRQLLPQRLLLGRTRRNTLVVLLACDAADRAASIAERLRRAMGSLGELLECEADLAIDSLDGPLVDIGAPHLLERLERRRDRRIATSRELTSDVPTLALRSSGERSAPAVATRFPRPVAPV